MPVPWRSLFERGDKPVVERIGFLSLPKTAETPTKGKSGGDARPVTQASSAPIPTAPMPTAPVDVPVSVPSIEAPRPAAVADVGSGPIVGTPAPTIGVRPSYSDPRVWATPDQIVSAPLSPSERLDSVLNVRLQAHQDSLATAEGAGPRRAPGDWTVEKDGKKYGMDSKYIRLGKVSIPTTLLAL